MTGRLVRGCDISMISRLWPCCALVQFAFGASVWLLLVCVVCIKIFSLDGICMRDILTGWIFLLTMREGGNMTLWCMIPMVVHLACHARRQRVTFRASGDTRACAPCHLYCRFIKMSQVAAWTWSVEWIALSCVVTFLKSSGFVEPPLNISAHATRSSTSVRCRECLASRALPRPTLLPSARVLPLRFMGRSAQKRWRKEHQQPVADLQSRGARSAQQSWVRSERWSAQARARYLGRPGADEESARLSRTLNHTWESLAGMPANDRWRLSGAITTILAAQDSLTLEQTQALDSLFGEAVAGRGRADVSAAAGSMHGDGAADTEGLPRLASVDTLAARAVPAAYAPLLQILAQSELPKEYGVSLNYVGSHWPGERPWQTLDLRLEEWLRDCNMFTLTPWQQRLWVTVTRGYFRAGSPAAVGGLGEPDAEGSGSAGEVTPPPSLEPPGDAQLVEFITKWRLSPMAAKRAITTLTPERQWWVLEVFTGRPSGATDLELLLAFIASANAASSSAEPAPTPPGPSGAAGSQTSSSGQATALPHKAPTKVSLSSESDGASDDAHEMRTRLEEELRAEAVMAARRAKFAPPEPSPVPRRRRRRRRHR